MINFAFNSSKPNVMANGTYRKTRRAYLVNVKGEQTEVTDDFIRMNIYMFTGDTSVFKSYLFGANRADNDYIALSIIETTKQNGVETDSVIYYKTIGGKKND